MKNKRQVIIMSLVKGIKKGKTIELLEDINIPDDFDAPLPEEVLQEFEGA